jgi:hypothetical protein
VIRRLVIAVALLLALGARAQQIGMLSVSNTFAVTSTNTLNAEFSTGDSLNVGFGFTFSLLAATGTSSNITVTVQKSIDGTNWDAYATCAIAASGTNVLAYWTNFIVGAIPRLRASTLVNLNTSAVQRAVFWRSLKREY